MPGPPAPFVPTPLPNIGKSALSPQGYSTTVKIEGDAVAIQGASFGSMGDVASKGLGGGIVSSNCEGPTKFIGPGAFDVKIEGKNVQLLSDPMMNNCGPSGSPANATTMAGLNQASGSKPTDEQVKQCKEQRTAINTKYEALGKELRKYDPKTDAIGGFPMKYGSGFTKPGGHFTEISQLQGGLKNDLTRFQKDCAGSGVQISRNVDRMANATIPRPPGI